MGLVVLELRIGSSSQPFGSCSLGSISFLGARSYRTVCMPRWVHDTATRGDGPTRGISLCRHILQNLKSSVFVACSAQPHATRFAFCCWGIYIG